MSAAVFDTANQKFSRLSLDLVWLTTMISPMCLA